ncbi:MAG: iron-containing alcohol dehydrogenase [Bacteroidetes bacterium]|nr:MAG: iron-containing alcohol dehydrogenase [Bacteroidota bacterium]
MDPSSLHADWHYPTSIRFGAGRIRELPDVCRLLGITRPLLVTDPGLAALPMLQAIVALNEAAGLPTAVFSAIRPNPTDANVEDGRAVYRRGGHDGIIAVGGGSALDTGKTIALLAGTPEPIWDVGPDWARIPAARIAPVVAVPTTAGTGSEVGRAAVITRTATRTKEIPFHPGMMPKAVLADPELTLSLPPHLTAGTGMDALAHHLEAFCAPYYHPMADGIAVEGMRRIKDWLPVAYRDGTHREARAHMLAAALMGAVAFQKGLGVIHALSHPVGALYDTHHGLTNAVFMPYALAFNRPAIEERMIRLARYLDLPQARFEAVLDWTLALRETLGVPHTLAELGVDDAHLDTLVAQATADPTAADNPVPLDAPALRRLFVNALEGRLV